MYALIEHKELDSAAASITFSNIPQNFTDLYVVTSLRSAASGATGRTYAFIKLNDSTSGYSSKTLWGTGSAVQTGSSSNASYLQGFLSGSYNFTANTMSSGSIYIANYTSSANKSISMDSVSENNGTEGYSGLTSGLWANNDPVSSVTIYPEISPNFTAGSSATLYGVNRTSAIGKPKAIGGNITYSNGYWVHTFTGSGTFYAQQYLEVDALVVAGGGAGGANTGGGGGAGGFQAISSKSIPPGRYGVVVGAGGTAYYQVAYPTKGSDSSAFGVTSLGGGIGGYYPNGDNLKSGGSGGGGTYQDSAGSGTSEQGNAGGSGANYGSGGGGGAGAAGEVGRPSGTSNGGIGKIWNGAYYAGGGGGGADSYRGQPAGIGGLGGGGNGGYAAEGVSGVANTGGGGGGGANTPDPRPIGGFGGSGVVIVRYRAD